jgi:hypothetical protein
MRRADNLTTFMCRLSWILGASTSWNPQGLSRPLMEWLYRLLCPHIGLLGMEPSNNSPSPGFGPVMFEFLASVTMKVTGFYLACPWRRCFSPITSVHIFETMYRFVLEEGCVLVVFRWSVPRLYTWAPLEIEVLVCDRDRKMHWLLRPSGVINP